MPRLTGDQPPHVARSALLGGSQTPINGPTAHRSGPTGLHHALAGVVSPRTRPPPPARRPAGPHHHASAPISPPPPPHHRSRAPCPPAHATHHRPTAHAPATGSPLAAHPQPAPRSFAQGPPAPGPPSPHAGSRGNAVAPVATPPPRRVKQGGGGCWFSACGIDFSGEGAGPGAVLSGCRNWIFWNCFAGGWDLELVGAGASWRSNANQVGR